MNPRTEYARLKSILHSDKTSAPEKFGDVLKSDLYVLLRNYFEINAEDIRLEVENDGRSAVILKVLAKAAAVKPMGGLPER